MKAFPIAAAAMGGLLVGLALGSKLPLFQRGAADHVSSSNPPPLTTNTYEPAPIHAGAEVEQLKAETERLRQDAAEVHRLRAEVSQLKRELDAKQLLVKQISSAPPDPKVLPANPEKSKFEQRVALSTVPPEIQASFQREIGVAVQDLALFKLEDKNGKTSYTYKGPLPDGRSVGLVIGDDGTVQHKSVDIAADTLPPEIQQSATQTFGATPISGARQVMENGTVSYELSAKNPQSGMQLTVGSDGSILSYSAKYRSPDEQRAQAAKKH